MANPEHLAILKQGVEKWNKWRNENPDVVPDLSKAGFREAELGNANFSEANLSGTDLTGAEIRNADLSRADLTYAILDGACLDGSDLGYAKLVGAKLVRGIGFFEQDLVGDPEDTNDAWRKLQDAVRSEGGSVLNVTTNAVYPFSLAYADYFIVRGRRLRGSSL